VIRR
jgi:hypothetical protein